MYDFVLFENVHKLENHYVDLGNLAELLKDAGYKVAFAHVFKEKELVNDKGIEIIQPKFSCPKFLIKKRKYNPVIGFFLRFLCSLYLMYVVISLKSKAKNFYIGSLTLGTPVTWLLAISKSKNYFIWGLRCHYLETWKRGNLSLYTLYSWCLYHIVKHRNNIKFILSHPIIKEEFQKRLNIDENRILVRPERFLRGDANITEIKHHDGLRLLTIGTLRRSKHVELVLDALRKINNSSFNYVIAGRCKNDSAYESMITEKMKGLCGIERINKFIDDDEYEMLMNNCDYLVLCDQPEPSCTTNGTMAEALLHGKPIIAPNYNPYKYEVETHHIGILYDFNNPESLFQALIDARKVDRGIFRYNLIQYQLQFTSHMVVNSIKEQLKHII